MELKELLLLRWLPVFELELEEGMDYVHISNLMKNPSRTYRTCRATIVLSAILPAVCEAGEYQHVHHPVHIMFLSPQANCVMKE